MVSQVYGCEPVQLFYKKSTDNNPTGAVNGAILVEVDSGLLYIYDRENDLWIAIRKSCRLYNLVYSLIANYW